MAYDYFQEQEDEQNQSASPQKSLGQDDSVATGNDPKQGAASGEGKGTSSGSFTNLNSYLDANRDQQFGQKVASKVSSQIDQADKTQADTDTSFRADVDKNTVNEDQDLISRASSSPESVDVEKFAQQRDATYKGPKNLVDRNDLYMGAQQATDNAYDTANQTRDENGRKAFLAQEYGTKQGRFDYSRGQQKLDNLLIQQDPSARQQFENNFARAAQTKDKFATLTGALNQYAGNAAAATAKTRADARSAIGIDDAGNWTGGGATGQALSALDKQVADRQAQLAREKAAVESTYGAKNFSQLTPEAKALEGFGLQPESFQGFDLRNKDWMKTGDYASAFDPYHVDDGDLLGYDPRAYNSMNYTDADVNRSSVADSSTQARLNALAKLAGRENTFINPADAGRLVGQPDYTAQGGKFGADVGARKAAMQAELAALMDRWNTAYKSGLIDSQTIRDEGQRVWEKYGLTPGSSGGDPFGGYGRRRGGA